MGPLDFGHEASSWCDPGRGRYGVLGFILATVGQRREVEAQ